MSEELVHWIGVDVASETFDAAVVGPDVRANAQTLRRLPVDTFQRTPEGVREFVTWIGRHVGIQDPLPVRVVMEATGAYSIELAAMMCKQCPELRPAIVNPQYTAAFRESLGLRNKTDRLDARALAFFGLERCPDAYEPMSKEQAELRDLSRCRDNLVATRVAYENQCAQAIQSTLVRKTLRGFVERANKAIERIEAQMRLVIQLHEQLRRDYELLTSIPSVGFVTATVVLAEFGDLRRFGSSRQIGAHAGVTPRKVESGKSTRPARMSKRGNARVRQALYMAALSSPQFNPLMRETYHHMVVQGKKRMVAIGAIMRKILVLMRAVVVSGLPFDPCGKPCGKGFKSRLIAT